jgi:hypothetical protein
MIRIYVDADGCPVKEEVYRVAKRYELPVTLVANTWMRAPKEEWLTLEVVEGEVNAADDWIAEHAGESDIVVTADIPLASRCLAKGAAVIDHRGGVFTEERIGQALASRELLSRLRDMGTVTGGPAPFDSRHRSRFLQRLDQTVHAVRAKCP